MDASRLSGEEPTDEGAIVEVPPGDYVLSIQMLDDAFEQKEDDLVPEYYLSVAPRLGDIETPPLIPCPGR